jgi:hypothetical protein
MTRRNEFANLGGEVWSREMLSDPMSCVSWDRGVRQIDIFENEVDPVLL